MKNIIWFLSREFELYYTDEQVITLAEQCPASTELRQLDIDAIVRDNDDYFSLECLFRAVLRGCQNLFISTKCLDKKLVKNIKQNLSSDFNVILVGTNSILTKEYSIDKTISILDRVDPIIFGLDDKFHAHHAFIGAFDPITERHISIIQKVLNACSDSPVLVLIRHSPIDKYSIRYRKSLVENYFKHMGIFGTAIDIPNIQSINWAKGMGLHPRFIDIDKEITLYAKQDSNNNTTVHCII